MAESLQVGKVPRGLLDLTFEDPGTEIVNVGKVATASSLRQTHGEGWGGGFRPPLCPKVFGRGPLRPPKTDDIRPRILKIISKKPMVNAWTVLVGHKLGLALRRVCGRRPWPQIGLFVLRLVLRGAQRPYEPI